MNLPPVPMLAAVPLLVLASKVPAQDTFVNWETPHVHPLDITPDGTRLLAVNLPDNRLEVFDLTGEAPAPIASIPVGLDPVSVRARTNTEAWVVCLISDSVSVVDLTTLNVVATLETEDEPCDVVFTAAPAVEGETKDPERAFVSCSQANSVLVFDPFDLTQAPTRIPIVGEDPRAMAVGPNGEVLVAVFESGNGTTILGGGIDPQFAQNVFPPNVVNHPDGPYGGQNPPPNDGAAFDPPIAAGLPVPPKVGLIVRRDDQGRWLDDNGGDWTELVSGSQAEESGRPEGWMLLDHDVAVIDPDTLDVSYVEGLMNLNMAIGVNPASGALSVVGTDCTNEIRFEPVLNGRFLRVQLGLVDRELGAKAIVDLNDHLDYTSSTVPQALRDATISDPRAIVWTGNGSRAYVAGMGTNNVVVIDATGARAGLAPTIEVGEGPTGLALDEARGRLYVMCKFDASISVVDTSTETVVQSVAFHDPSPEAIQVGRRQLYDAHETSGLGLTACASCHVDARMDRLAWDLGNPEGEMKTLEGNLGGGVPGLDTGFEDWHPMKGPMLTQTLQDIIGKEPHHWRADRLGIEEFRPAFVGLLGDDVMPTPQDTQEFEDFLATIHYPPNPFRRFDNSLAPVVPLEGHYATGRFALPAGVPLPDGNAVQGERLFRPPNTLDGPLACVSCHTRPTGAGTDHQWNGSFYEPIPPGANGERHLALISMDGSTNVTLKIPQMRNLYERVGLEMTQTENTAGFGYIHDGSVDSLARFVSEPVFETQSDQQVANLVAFMLSFSGDSESMGSTTALLRPPGPPSLSTHAAVGAQVTLDGPADPQESALLDDMIVLADAGDVGLVVKGRRGGLGRGWTYLGANRFQSDRKIEIVSRAALEGGVGSGNELTFTVVPFGTQERIGVDRDEDGALDRDELDAGTDPADPTSKPRLRRSPGMPGTPGVSARKASRIR